MVEHLLVVWVKDSLDAVYSVKRHVGTPVCAPRSSWVGLCADGSKVLAS